MAQKTHLIAWHCPNGDTMMILSPTAPTLTTAATVPANLKGMSMSKQTKKTKKKRGY